MPDPTRKKELLEPTDPPILLAILIAARRTGDDLLETVVRRQLEEKHQIAVRFLGEVGAASCKLPNPSSKVSRVGPGGGTARNSKEFKT